MFFWMVFSLCLYHLLYSSPCYLLLVDICFWYRFLFISFISVFLYYSSIVFYSRSFYFYILLLSVFGFALFLLLCSIFFYFLFFPLVLFVFLGASIATFVLCSSSHLSYISFEVYAFCLIWIFLWLSLFCHYYYLFSVILFLISAFFLMDYFTLSFQLSVSC